MPVRTSLDRMHREAIARLRSGDHSEFLVGFMSAAVMGELAKLGALELDVHGYTQAAVDVLTTNAPVDRCRVTVDVEGLPPTQVGVGGEAGSDPSSISVGRDHPDGRVVITIDHLAPALRDGGFVEMVLDQFADGLTGAIDAERARRTRAVLAAQALVRGLDASWGAEQLQAIAEAACWHRDCTSSRSSPPT